MISVVCSSQNDLTLFKEHVIKTSGLKNKIEFLGYKNDNEFSLTEIYNKGLKDSKFDIVIFLHHDIEFDTNNWGHKILKHFQKHPKYGIIGVAGTTYMPTSGKWWEDPRQLIGIVNHAQNGKKWESKYSDYIQNGIKETIIVDGVFMIINKKNIKHTFDETVKGYHMYDIHFCFQNYLDGVKIGVITDIRITHKSVGITNESWEENRKIFAEKYQSILPVKIPKTENDKLKILIACSFFRTFTGSELYVFELATGLVKLGHDVTILSNPGGVITDITKREGVKVMSFREPPGFKLGDGKWGLNTEAGKTPSKPNTLYQLFEPKFDIIHVQHKPVTEQIINLYPNYEKIATIHSEVIDIESPVIHPSIKKYIAIRPEIKEHISKNFQIDENNIEVIYNPIDNNKFKPTSIKQENSLLFVGTIDYLRKETIYDLLKYTKEKNMEFWIVGEDKSKYGEEKTGYLEDLLTNPNVKYFMPIWNIQDLIHKCKETAGILLGRTTIESWMCGNPSWIYDIDKEGHIINKQLHEIPNDLDKYKSTNVIKEINKLYLNVINEIAD